jgi:hypothetical protein
MKYLFLSLGLAAALSTSAQIKVTQGSNSPEFVLTKQPVFTSYATDNGSYFLICNKNKLYEKSYNLIMADKSGTIVTNNEVKINAGSFNNMNNLTSLLVVNNNPVAFVENHNKESGKNILTAGTVDQNGAINATPIIIGSLNFTKMSNPGNWYISVSPDKKHVAIVGKLPHEKNAPDQFNYILLDGNLKEQSKGQFNFAGMTKEIQVKDFLTSDKGDLYLLSEDEDKSYTFPMVYKYTPGTSGQIIPVIIADGNLRNLSYTYTINPAGDLLIAGYMQKKKTFLAGDPEAVGTWAFTSAKPSEVKTFNSDQPTANIVARNLVFNGDTYFLVGEQYKAEAERSNVAGRTGFSTQMLSPTYVYNHNNIMVTGFSADNSKKFEMPLSRSWSTRSTDQDLMVASGIVNNKLTLVFNDEYDKYIEDKYHEHKGTKLPVAVAITNNGLMENPVHFAKQLDILVSTYTLLPQYFNPNNGRLVVLTSNGQSVKTVTFQQ